MQRLVTVCLGLLVLCWQAQVSVASDDLVIYGVSINAPTSQQDEDTRGDILEDPTRIRIINLGKVVNHAGLDYGPTVSADGKTLYFVSNRKGSRLTRDNDYSHDFWATKKLANLDTVFFPPFNIDTVDAGVNTVFNEGVATISADRQTLIFTGCNRPDGLGDCDLYSAEIQGDRWGTPVNLGRNVNSEFWDSQPTISPNKQVLYFASNRPSPTNPDGEGHDDVDIWYTEWDEDMGEWKPAKNMGPEINTDQREEAPFIAADGVSLFFSSNGHKPNMGGLDFYRSRKTGKKEQGRELWSKPQQLPAPINTDEDDQFITMPASGDVLYFSSRRTDLPGYQGDLDVFMAFVPTYFRAVNLIVNVIDECTGQNIPATLSFRNAKTGRTSKDSVNTSRVESNVIVGNDDYGVDANRENTVQYTVTASSPVYGERSITVDVADPGRTLDASKANEQSEIRKTITLGTRPVITWEAAPSEYARRNNDPFRGLVIQEKATISLDPLLPYIFFDLNSSKMPARYILFTSSSQTAAFNDQRLTGGTLDKYYHTLNIYGYRLRNHPSVKLEINGCVDADNEDKNSSLMSDRAQVIYNYFRDIWGISEERMTITTQKGKGWPDVRSNPKDSLGIVENRRVELRFSGGDGDDRWLVERPIYSNDPTYSPSPYEVTFGLKNGIDNEIVASRRVEVTWNGKPWNVLKEVGVTDASKVWDWTSMQGEPHPPVPEGSLRDVGKKEMALSPFEAVLIVTSKNGQECKSDPKPIPVRFVTSTVLNAGAANADSTYEKYNLILFPFDKFIAGPMNERILQEYVYRRVKPSSVVTIEGHTDVVGMDDHNLRLSQNRSRTVYDLLNKASKGKYGIMNSRGTGEEEPLYRNELPEERFFNRTVQVRISTPLNDADATE